MSGSSGIEDFDDFFDRRQDLVLVVDDEQDIRESLKDLLEDEFSRVQVATCADAEAGLRHLEDQRTHLIIVDYKMPGMSGLEFLRKARDHVKPVGRTVTPQIPKILITAFPDLDVATKAINEGRIAKFFTKPLDPDEVIEAVRSILYDRPDRGFQRE